MTIQRPNPTISSMQSNSNISAGSSSSTEQTALFDDYQQLRIRLADLDRSDPRYAEGQKLLQACELALINMHFRYQAGPLPPGVRQLTDAELSSLGIDPASLNNKQSGYRAGIYFDELQNRYIYVNDGSNGPLDWLTNGSQLVGLGSPQYSQAIKNANQLAQAAKASGKGLVFTGHSLGGGLASAQAYETGYQAITFNAAGLNRNTLSAEGQARFDQQQSLVQAYQVPGDPLSLLQEDVAGLLGLFFSPASDVPVAAGQQYDLPRIKGKPGYQHSLAGVATSLSKGMDTWLSDTAANQPGQQAGWAWLRYISQSVLSN